MFRSIPFRYLHDSNGENSDAAIMSLCKDSYFILAAGLRHLWPNSAIANGTTYVNYLSPVSKWNTKNHSFQWSTNETSVNNWYLDHLNTNCQYDIDFNLEVCVIVSLEAWTTADFFKGVPNNYNSVNMLHSLSYKVQQIFKFTFRKLECNHIWCMFAVIKVLKTYCI